MEAKVTVPRGAAVTLGPQPISGGSWKWTGPHGYTSASRENGNVPLGTGANVYVATYTDSSGCVSHLDFIITVTAPNAPSQTGAANCPSTVIAPYMQVNGGSWDAVSSETVVSGASVTLGPQPISGGSWSWSGPRGFSSKSRENYNVPLSTGTNVYAVAYTDPSGCVSHMNFAITVTASHSKILVPEGTHIVASISSGVASDDAGPAGGAKLE